MRSAGGHTCPAKSRTTFGCSGGHAGNDIGRRNAGAGNIRYPPCRRAYPPTFAAGLRIHDLAWRLEGGNRTFHCLRTAIRPAETSHGARLHGTTLGTRASSPRRESPTLIGEQDALVPSACSLRVSAAGTGVAPRPLNPHQSAVMPRCGLVAPEPVRSWRRRAREAQ